MSAFEEYNDPEVANAYGNGGSGPYNNNTNYGMNNYSYGNSAYSGNAAPSTPTKSSTPKQEVPIVCSMIGTIITNDGSDFKYFDCPIKNVCIVGLVSSHNENASNSIDYLINDCTGTISGRFFTNGNTQPITGGYVMVNCSLRFFQDRISINIYNIQPITNMNEVTEHLLNCIVCYEYYKKRYGRMDVVTPAVNDYTNNALSDLDRVDQMIYSFIKSKMGSPEFPDGVSSNAIVSYCATKGISENDVKFRIEEMVSNIRIFESGPDFYSCQYNCLLVPNKQHRKGYIPRKGKIGYSLQGCLEKIVH